MKEVEGNISSNTNWSGNIKVTGDVTVLNGVRLTIYPGTYVEFQGPFCLNVQGNIQALGSSTDTIIFTIYDSTGFHDQHSKQGAWHGIRFDDTPETNLASNFLYCLFEYAKATEGLPETSSTHDNGGAIFSNSSVTITLQECTIRNCSAVNYGGAIFSDSQQLNLLDCEIYHNTAQSGGALFIGNNAVYINGNKICNNIAKAHGGGIYLAQSDAEIANNIITNNDAVIGGGIFIFAASPYILNNTICNNKATTGGGVFFINPLDGLPENPRVSNCIVRGNRGNNFYGAEAMTIEYCNNGGEYAGEGNIDLEPEFINSNLGAGKYFDGLNADWNIGHTSPCRDAGDPDINDATITRFQTDIAGTDRVVCGRIDIGAYEYIRIEQIPGRIEAEDYLDMEGVQVEETGDFGGGKNICNIENKCGAHYIINSETAGDYILNLRIASECIGGRIELFLDEGKPDLTIPVPFTANWQNYVTLPLKLSLPKGETHFLYAFFGSGYIANLNYFEILQPKTSVTTIPAKIEAEDFNDFSGVVIGWYYKGEVEEYIGWLDAYDYAEYKIDVHEDDTYNLKINAASNSNEGIISVLINDMKKVDIPVENTGGWENYTILTQELELKKGENDIRLVFNGLETAICNVDYLEFEKKSAAPTDISLKPPVAELNIFPNPSKGKVFIKSTQSNPLQSIELYDLTGKILFLENILNTHQYTLLLPNLPQGIYLLKVVINDKVYCRKISFEE